MKEHTLRSTSFILLTLMMLTVSCQEKNVNEKQYNNFHPGKEWKDNNGVHINAHGGGMLHHEGTYYWFGEHKVEGRKGNKAQVGVHCYSSTDLYNWKDEGIVLKVKQDTNSLLEKGCIVERPKVIYNKKNDEFVMWFHHELKGMGYDAAMTGLAVAQSVTGPYEYKRSVNPNAWQWPRNFTAEQNKPTQQPDEIEKWSEEWKQAVGNGMFLKRDFEKGQMARDMTLFVDDDGTAYHIHSSEENSTLHISELRDDYRNFSGRYIRVRPGHYNEAPSIFKHQGKYYMIASGCTGWDPNAARLLVADSVMGSWEHLGNPCIGESKEITFDSQSTYILPVQGKKDAFIFMADRWEPENPIEGTYVWLPIQFDKNGTPYLEWMDQWSLKFFMQ